MRTIHALVFVLALLTAFFAGQEKAIANFEFGGTLGTPAGFNLNMGYWSPFLVRASGGYWGKSIGGGQLEIGYAYDLEETTWMYFSGAGTVIDGANIRWVGVGPFWGMNAKGISLEVGLSFGRGELRNNDVNGAQLMFQIGYTYIWGRK